MTQARARSLNESDDAAGEGWRGQRMTWAQTEKRGKLGERVEQAADAGSGRCKRKRRSREAMMIERVHGFDFRSVTSTLLRLTVVVRERHKYMGRFGCENKI